MAGGSSGNGVIFSMASDGTDCTVLHHFAALDAGAATNSGGAMPSAGLTISNGIIYGKTLAGGAACYRWRSLRSTPY